jgi:hypothetical protein
MTELSSWNDTPTRQAIVDFVESAAQNLPPEERVAVFDNDGTLWCEKPMPIELGFILQRFVAMAKEDESLREKEPWRAAYERDFAWLGGAVDKHYAGDDSDLKVLMGGSSRHTAARRSRSSRTPPRPSWPTRPTPRSAGGSATAGTCRWWSSCATSRITASRASSPRAGAATSCG